MNYTSKTGWFKYKGENAPSSVISHLKERDDVKKMEVNADDEFSFYSENGRIIDDIFDPDGEDGFPDYGVILVDCIDSPTELPQEYRDEISPSKYFDNAEFANFLERLGMTGDPRNYMVGNRIRMTLDSVRGKNQYVLEPAPFNLICEMKEKDFMRENIGTDYPSIDQMKDWKSNLEKTFTDSRLYGIGFVQAKHFHFDGIIIEVDAEDFEEAKSWAHDKFGENPCFSHASEIHFYDEKWIRVWWD